MALTKKQKAFGDSLLDSMGNVTIACGETGANLQDFRDWMKIPEFKAMHDTSIQIRDDQALIAFMGLIEAGDRSATIEYQKMMRQSADEVSLKQLQKEFMRILIQLAETKTICLKEYCGVFSSSQKMAEKQYTAVIAEYNLKSPFERAKEKKKKQDDMMSTLFESGNLSEIDMYKKMLAIALYDAENSEYPSERSRAMDKVVQINQRLEEINDRKRREEESDDQNIFNKLDAVLAGVTPGEIDALKQKVTSNRLELSDATTDS